MLKRKNSNTNLSYENNNNVQDELYDLYYFNGLNNDSIKLKDNNIYFTSTINDQTINKLIEFIQYIHNKNCNNTINIHITSKGGTLVSLLAFIEYRKKNNIYLTSIILNECNDAAIILANLCDYKLITKKSTFLLSKYDFNYVYNYYNNSNYWGFFKQCNNDEISINNFKDLLFNLLLNKINSKLNSEKLSIYLKNTNTFDSKKCKKLGLVNDIIEI